MPNQIVVHGTVAAPPDLRYTPTGVAVCTTQLMCTFERTVSTGSETATVEELTVFNTLTFGAMGEHTADSFVTGNMVIVTGRMRTDTTTGGMELVADDIAASARASTVLPVRADAATPPLPRRRQSTAATDAQEEDR